jgi:diaminopimelate epimerase
VVQVLVRQLSQVFNKAYWMSVCECNLRGGELDIRWQGSEGHPVWMTGPTARVFDGVLRMYEWQ